MGALDGLLVIDLSRVLAGPFCGQMLADNGAQVIKVESPEGDMNRAFPQVLGPGDSTNYRSVNRGKRGATLNLKSPAAREVLDRMIAKADVLIQSFLPKVAIRLGVDWERVHELNPDLVYVSISGYGAKGPLADKPGYDTMVAAYSGVMSLTGEPDRPPVRPGVTTIDLSTGMLAYSGVVSALLARERGKARGQRVDVSLLETGITLLGFHGVSYLTTGQVDEREGAGYTTLAPYGAFRARDGELMLGAPTEAMWLKACDALNAQELVDDPRFRTNADRCANRETLRAEIERRLATADVTTWTERLEAAGVATSPINTVDRAIDDAQTRANDMVVESVAPDRSTQRLLGMPFKLSATPGAAGAAPPTIGQDTRAVMQEVLGYSAAEVDALAAKDAF